MVTNCSTEIQAEPYSHSTDVWLPGFKNQADFKQACKVLIKAGYRHRNIIKLLEGKVTSSEVSSHTPRLLKLTNGGSSFETLVRLLLLNVETPVDDTRRAMDSMGLEPWIDAGVIRVEGNTVIPKVRLLRHKGLFVAVETVSNSCSRQPNTVLGISPSSVLLAEMTINRPTRRMLDLGCGCGIQALLAAKFCRQVIATDLNPRAVMLTRFNARLNDLSNITVLQGDMFEPVKGQKFDLITSNPPYVISPEASYLYRDSGKPGDTFIQELIRKAEAHLTDMGYCQFSGNWAHLSGQPWEKRLAQWFDQVNCDAWAIRHCTWTPAGYTKCWYESGMTAEEKKNQTKQWLGYFQREGITAISSGLINLRRRRARANWIRLDDWTEKPGPGAGQDVIQGFALADFLERTRDEERLNKARLYVSPRVCLEQKSITSGNGWQPRACRLTRLGGLRCSQEVDQWVLDLVGQCDGQVELGKLLKDIATSFSKVDSSNSQRQRLQVVRRLINRGFLLPVVSSEVVSQGMESAESPKVMILTRGLPSCGKSYISRKLAEKGGLHLEFDQFFFTQIGHDPTSYDWSADLMPQARCWNLGRIFGAIEANASPIIVDSDNSPGPYTGHYVAHAVNNGYEIRFQEPESSWWQVIKKLLQNKEQNVEPLRLWAQQLNKISCGLHRVPYQEIHKRMMDWEPITVKRILEAGKQKETPTR